MRVLAAAPAAAPRPARPAVGRRLLAGPDPKAGWETLDRHLRRLGGRPAGGEWLLGELGQSGLRGRGGAWFPTWRKWDAVAMASAGQAVVVVNASEGEPLSAKDHTLLSLRPHLVLDGAVLAAETVGAEEVVIYLSRGSKATERTLDHALVERRYAGLTEPAIRVLKTAHRYVAGESSAAISRVSGGPSKPRFSLQRSAERGVRDQPTLVQNVETLAHVGMLARFGSRWFRELGTDLSPGTALLTLTGSVRRPGVYEVDLAAPLGPVLQAAGGTLSAPAGALVGGYFGTWLRPEDLEELPLDAERLRQGHSASLGCGVVAVLPDDACAVVEASRVLSYLAAETAGQCGPCVNGLAALAETMDRIAHSRAERGDLAWVHRWSEMVRGRGGCHHPDGAVGQLTSVLAAFEDHVDEHLAGRRCRGLEARGFPPPPSSGRKWK